MEDIEHEARYYHRSDDCIKCDLCPHGCIIRDGSFGLCRARYAEEGKLFAYSYGHVSSIAIDPIEKKPLYHYCPGSEILSVGGVGCNMHCDHCQNHPISQIDPKCARIQYLSPSDLVSICEHEGLRSIAFTYNEPSIWFEYIMDTIKCGPSLRYVLVTNGLINDAPLKELCKVIDAMNIDVKGFTDDFYRKICGAELSDIKRSVKTAFNEGVHIELTYLLIPGMNDSPSEIHEFGKWVMNDLSPEIPVHITRFHPDNRMTDLPCTPLGTMADAKEILISEGINFVYLGNTTVKGGNDTMCPECRLLLVERDRFNIIRNAVSDSKCPGCGRIIERFITE